MVLGKWAVVSRSAPPPPGLRPLARHVPTHPKLVPADYKPAYVLRSFVRDRHLSEVQHLENRGMLQEELCIERARFPRWHKTLTVQTDGSLNEREVEFVAPPLLLLFHDRLMVHKQRQRMLRSLGYGKNTHYTTPRNSGGDKDDGNNSSSDSNSSSSDNSDTTRSANAVCNALTFPYCVPARMRVRACCVDPLKVSNTQDEEQGAGDDAAV